MPGEIKMLKSSIIFIINPISGGKKKTFVIDMVNDLIDKEKFLPSFEITTHVGHAAVLARDAVKTGIKTVVAVGGDGTINEVAGALVGSESALAVIPFGSGNGLARFLHIPLKVKKAIDLINTGSARKIDSAEMNGKPFFNIAGIGFDAHVSAAFASNKRRGLVSYIKIGLTEYLNYKGSKYAIEIDGVNRTETAFIISIANSNQYGNDFKIAHDASVTDGLLDFCILRPIPFYMMLVFFYRLLIKKDAEKMKCYEIVKCKSARIIREDAAVTHLDGEPTSLPAELNVRIVPLSLLVICPVGI